jgi:hypothetical protein
MNIPEILDWLEEPDLEDWLTAAFLENESRLPLDRLCTDGAYPSPGCTPDIWMLEITHRTGKFWRGRFNVEFSQVNRNGPQKETTIESQTARLFFTLDIETAEVTFDVDASAIPETSGSTTSRLRVARNLQTPFPGAEADQLTLGQSCSFNTTIVGTDSQTGFALIKANAKGCP